MGTGGNIPGYKVFSISTTIRNPRRNSEFLEVLRDFDQKELTSEVKGLIYFELIKRGIYKFTNLNNEIKEKYKAGIELEDDEIFRAINENPQKTGDEGRVMTQIRALKDTGLLSLTGRRNQKLMTITPLGHALLTGSGIEEIYIKAMVGLHTKNPQRMTIFNESRPFLNLLFVINELNKHYENEKGILWHEFSVFVLSMKDCNYRLAVEEIIKYRTIFKNSVNQEYLENYLYNTVKVNNIEFSSILKDYADDVFRKFNMTGLVISSGFGENVYIRFNEYNLSKVEFLLKEYVNYKFINFESTEQYIEYISNIVLPWEISVEAKKSLVQHKKEVLGINVDDRDSIDTQISKLDKIYNKRIFDSSIDKYDIELIKKELVILGRNQNVNSKFDEIPGPVRLEWLIAMATAKIYGSKYVKPNLMLDEVGIPKSFAAGGMSDIEFVTDELYCLIEVTLQKDYKQQLNNETTSISDHLKDIESTQQKCSLLIAPRIHNRVAQFFKYTTTVENLSILALTIEYYIEMIEKNNTIFQFKNVIEELTKKMCENEVNIYCDFVNEFKVDLVI